MKTAAERVRERRVRLKNEGRCVICAKADAQPEKTMCEPCQADTYERVRARRERLKEAA